MPVYEYRCLDCGKGFTIRLSYADYGIKSISCPACGSGSVKRHIGRIRIGHSEEQRLENIADPAMLNTLDTDPAAMGGMMRKMKDQMGEEIAPEFDEVVDRLEKGQTPEQIEQELPELGSEDPSGVDFNGADDF